jgi:steroid delta-isomerase-like uncharacterized protein
MAPNMFLTNWVRTTYSMEMGLLPVLEKQTTAVAEDPQSQQGIKHHLEATRRHTELMRSCLERLGDSDLGIKPAEPVVSALSRGDGGGADATFHTVLIDYVAEHYEIASYRALARLALRAGDPETARVCNQILRDEIAMVDALDLGQPEAGTVHARETGSPAGQVQANVQVARDSFDALNEQDLDRYDKFMPDNVRVDSPGVRSPMDRWQQHDYLDGLLGAFPGAHFEITRVIAQGDHVVVDWIASGTQTQPLQSPDGQTFPASDKQVRLPASTTLEVRQGKIRRAWNYWDMGSLIAQISPTHMM